MKKLIIASLFAILLLPNTGLKAASAADVNAQIQTLTEQLTALQAQLNSISGGASSGTADTTETTSSATPPAYTVNQYQGGLTLTRNLGLGSIGADVVQLQEFLRKYSFFSGESSTIFGPKTFQAVKQFQASNRIESTGYVGEQTRLLLSSYGFAPSQPVVSFNASANNVTSGQAVTLSWNTIHANSCALTNSSDGSSIGVGIPQSYRTVYPTKTTTYTLKCLGDTDSATKLVTVNVAADPYAVIPPLSIPIDPAGETPVVSFTANPSTIAYGSGSTLTLNATNANYCSIPELNLYLNSGLQSFTKLVSPTQTTNYTATCFNGLLSATPSVTKTATVGVTFGTPPTPTIDLTLSSNTVTVGQPVTVTWNATNANYCDNNDFIAGNAVSGSKQITKSTVGTYNIVVSCHNGSYPSSKTATLTVTAAPTVSTSVPIVDLKVNGTNGPVTLNSQNDTVSLSWTSSDNGNSYYCWTGQGYSDWSGNQILNGSKTVRPSLVAAIGQSASGSAVSSVEYEINCTDNASGKGNADYIIVNMPQASTPAPTVSLTASPITITSGQTTKLTLNTTNADTCSGSLISASGGWTKGSGTTNSSVFTFSPTQTTTYSVTCANSAGQSMSDAATVVVNPTTVSAPTITFTATPSSITPGQSATLTWSLANTSSCTINGSYIASGNNQIQTSVAYPSQSTSYTLTCVNSAGTSASKTVTVSVAPVSQTTGGTGTGVSLTINGSHGPVTVSPSGSLNYAWSAPGAFFCEFTSPFNSGVQSSGSSIVYYGHPFFPTTDSPTKTFTVRCYNTNTDYSAGRVTGSDSVTVNLAIPDNGANVYTALSELLKQLQSYLKK